MNEPDNKLVTDHSQHGFSIYNEKGQQISGKCWVDEDGVVRFTPNQPDHDPERE